MLVLSQENRIVLVFLVFEVELEQESGSLDKVVARVLTWVLGNDSVVLELREVHLRKQNEVILIFGHLVRLLIIFLSDIIGVLKRLNPIL